MALHSKEEELVAAWRALANEENSEGWRSISMTEGGSNRVLAGRHFPDGQQALLIGFGSIHMPVADKLPKGEGFLVLKADLGSFRPGLEWIALCCQSPGRLDLFTLMASDVVSTVERYVAVGEEEMLQAFLARIRAWQDFMRQPGNGLLAPDAEVGLLGEILLLRDMIRSGLGAKRSVEAWQGPLRGLQDFQFGTGAIEAKATSSGGGFVVLIGSLDQLDDAQTSPLFLAATRFRLDPAGETLPGFVAEVERLVADDDLTREMFQGRLIHAGYAAGLAREYHRRFCCEEQRLIRVEARFPRLTRAEVPVGIIRARYEIDVDTIVVGDLELGAALEELGGT